MMAGFDAHQAAAALLEARRAHRQVLPLASSIAPRDEREGAAAQRALAEALGAARPAGFKIGATTKRMQAYLGIDGPAAGFMPAAGVRESGATLNCAAFRAPGVECELAVRLARDLPSGPCSETEAASAVADVVAAI